MPSSVNIGACCASITSTSQQDEHINNESNLGHADGDDGATHAEAKSACSSSFHASRFYKREGFFQSLARHEHYLAKQMQLRPGMRVLDVGCAVGLATREIAAFSGAQMVGVNDNEAEVQHAWQYVKHAGLEAQVVVVKRNFMNLVEQFGENSFDAVYAIGTTCHAASWEDIYGQIKQMLKPGGVFGVYKWCMTDAWDPSIQSHKELAQQLEICNGIPEMRSLRDSRQAFINVGFKIEHEEDLAERPDALPWYYPLECNILKVQTVWDLWVMWVRGWSGELVTDLLEMIGLAPEGAWEVGKMLKVAGDALVNGGQTKLFTPMYLVIARKP